MSFFFFHSTLSLWLTWYLPWYCIGGPRKTQRWYGDTHYCISPLLLLAFSAYFLVIFDTIIFSLGVNSFYLNTEYVRFMLGQVWHRQTFVCYSAGVLIASAMLEIHRKTRYINVNEMTLATYLSPTWNITLKLYIFVLNLINNYCLENKYQYFK